VRGPAGALAFLLTLAGTAPAQEAPRFRWDHEGLASVLDAAAAARPAGKRLLLGLSGSPT
jgi:hypothetical protein